jgi:hypothetical protein
VSIFDDDDDDDAVMLGRAMHELLHALGIFHEQSRNDRDRFVKIVWDNVSLKDKHKKVSTFTKSDQFRFQNFSHLLDHPLV